MTGHPNDHTPPTAPERLSEQELAVWRGRRRPGMEPLTEAEQAKFAPLAAALQRAQDAGFRLRPLIVDTDRDDPGVDEITMARERPDGPTEVIVFASHRWAFAFRVPAGAPLFGKPDIDGEPNDLVGRVLAGAWPTEEP